MNLPVLYLQSDSLSDIYEIQEKEFWEHSCTAREIQPGETLLIGPNSKIRSTCESTEIVGVLATLLSQDKVYNQDDWPSDNIRHKKYVCRYYVADIDYITKSEVEQFIANQKVNQRGLIYLDGRCNQQNFDYALTYHGNKPAAKYVKKLFGVQIIDQLLANGYDSKQLILDRTIPFAEFVTKYNLNSSMLL